MTTEDKYALLLLTFTGAIMAQAGCDRTEALTRIATLMAITEEQVFKNDKGAPPCATS